jgi:hypothetical protein
MTLNERYVRRQRLRFLRSIYVFLRLRQHFLHFSSDPIFLWIGRRSDFLVPSDELILYVSYSTADTGETSTQNRPCKPPDRSTDDASSYRCAAVPLLTVRSVGTREKRAECQSLHRTNFLNCWREGRRASELSGSQDDRTRKPSRAPKIGGCDGPIVSREPFPS